MRAPSAWRGGAPGAALVAALLAGPALAAPRVYALDQCADQYVLALSPRRAIVGLSKRADDPDAYSRTAARGLPQGRATTEAVLAARPQVVVRYWGGDERLARTLERRGIAVVRVEDAADFDGVAANVRRVAAALGARDRGEGIVARMRSQLAASRGAWRGQRALYLTPGGYTAGQGTLIDALMRAAGLDNIAAGPGFQAVPLERLVLRPPAMLVEGFFDNTMAAFQRWSPGRHRLVRRLARERVTVALPGSILGCPAWFAAEGSLRLARAR